MLIIVRELADFQNSHYLGEIESVAVTSDSKFLISGSQDRSIKVFDLDTKKQVHHFQNAHEGYSNYSHYQ